MSWIFLVTALLVITAAVENKNEEEAKKLLKTLLISKHDLLSEDVKLEEEDPRLPNIFTPEVEDNITDPDVAIEAKRLYTEALKTLQLEEVKGEKKTAEIVDYLRKAAQLGHKTSTKLLAYFNLFDGNFDEINKIRDTFEFLALDGSPDGQFGLGFLYSTGIGGIKQNTAKAITYYNFAAIGGCSMATMAMGYRHLHGVGVAKECFRAVEFYYDAATLVVERIPFYMSPPDPKLRLTDAFDPDTINKRLLPSSDEEMDYLKMKVSQGDPQLAAQLGILYLTGKQGVLQNYELAKKYLKEAALAGEGPAMAYLGAMYLDGTPVTPASNTTAYKYFYDAAMKGDVTGICGLGYMYLFGYGVRADHKVASALLTHAIDKGSSLANVYLGLYLEHQGYTAKAAKLFEQAARKGETLGIFNLARLHYRGHGVPQSCPIATQLFRLVAERGELNKWLMGAFQTYRNKDYNKAAAMYLLLAEMGFDSAQLNFAHIVDQGEVAIGEPTALTYWKRAAVQGSSYATVKMGDYYYYGRGGVDKNLTQSFEQYEIAAKQYKSALAMFNLGVMHEWGDGARKDPDLARRYYHLASEISPSAYYPTYLAEMRMDFVEWLQKKAIFQQLDSHFKYWDIVCCGMIAFLVSYLFFSVRRQ